MRRGDLGQVMLHGLEMRKSICRNTIEDRKYWISAIFRSLRAGRPRTQALRRDEFCDVWVNNHYANDAAKARTVSHFFSTATARSVISRPLQINSHLTSSTSSKTPLVPMAGFALSLGLN